VTDSQHVVPNSLSFRRFGSARRAGHGRARFDIEISEEFDVCRNRPWCRIRPSFYVVSTVGAVPSASLDRGAALRFHLHWLWRKAKPSEVLLLAPAASTGTAVTLPRGEDWLLLELAVEARVALHTARAGEKTLREVLQTAFRTAHSTKLLFCTDVADAAPVCDRAAETRRDVESRRGHIEVRMGTILIRN
jgi:hypothetical protein